MARIALHSKCTAASFTFTACYRKSASNLKMKMFLGSNALIADAQLVVRDSGSIAKNFPFHLSALWSISSGLERY